MWESRSVPNLIKKPFI